MLRNTLLTSADFKKKNSSMTHDTVKESNSISRQQTYITNAIQTKVKNVFKWFAGLRPKCIPTEFNNHERLE